MIHKEVKVYVDDMIVKSKDRKGHLGALRKFFERLKRYGMRLNPQKYTFRVTTWKLLGFLITQRGIKIDPTKVKARMEMQPPKNEKEVRGFLRRVQFISRFISKLIMTCDQLFKLLRKGENFEWNDKCQATFNKIKVYLQTPPILSLPEPNKPLLLYLAVSENSMGCMLAQDREERHVEKAIYYLSKRMSGYELNCPPLEKTC